MNNKAVDKNPSSLVSSGEVLNSLTNESCGEEGIVTMDIDSSCIHEAPAAQSITGLQTNTEPLVLLATKCEDSTFADCNNKEGNSVCDLSMASSDEESLVPSAKALSVALQTTIIPFGHAEGSLLATDEDETVAAGKCSLEQHRDILDLKASIDAVLEDSDFDSDSIKPESPHLSCASDSNNEKGISEFNILIVNAEEFDEEEVTQTLQCDFVELNTQETVNENILSRHADVENVDKGVGNNNDFNLPPSKTEDPDFVVSADAHERDFSVSEDSDVSVTTNNAVRIFPEASNIEHYGNLAATHCSKSTGLPMDVKDNSDVTVDGSLLENNDISLKEEESHFQNDREWSVSSVSSSNSPLIEFESLEFRESENYVEEQSQNNNECAPRSEEVEESPDSSLSGKAAVHDVSSLFEGQPGLSKFNKSFGINCTVEEEEKKVVARHFQVKSECTEENLESGNLAQNVGGVTQLRSKSNLGKGIADVCLDHNSVANNRTVMDQVSTQSVTVIVSQLELDAVDPVKLPNETINHPAGNCETTQAAEICEGIERKATEITESELSNSSKSIYGLTDQEETSLFNFQETTPEFLLGEGDQVGESRSKEEYPAICATTEARRTTEMHLRSFSSSSTDLQIDSSSYSLTIPPHEETNDTSMALDFASKPCVKGHTSESTLNGVVEGVDIIQDKIEHAVGTQQVTTIGAASNYGILTKVGKRSDLISLEPTLDVPGERLKGSEGPSEENETVSSVTPCFVLELNSERGLSKHEEISLNIHASVNNRGDECQHIGSDESGQYSVEQSVHEQSTISEEVSEKQQIKTSQTGQTETQFSEAEVSHAFSDRNEDNVSGKPDNLLTSLDNLCSTTLPHEDNTKTLILPEKGNDVKNESQTSTSEDLTMVSTTMNSKDKDMPPNKGAGLNTEKQTKEETDVPLPSRIDESKPRVDKDDKEEGEITSDEDDDDTSQTQKPTDKEREEGELSTSDSDVEAHIEASSHEKQGGAAVPGNKVPLDKNVFNRKGKELYPTRRHSSSDVHQKLSNEKSRVPEKSSSNRRASSSSFKNKDLRTKLSEARKERTSIKGTSSGIRETREDRLRRESRPVEKGVKKIVTEGKCSAKSGNRKGSSQGKKAVRDGTKAGREAKVRSLKPEGASQVKRRETRQRVTGTSDEGKPGSNQRRDGTSEKSLKSANKEKAKPNSSLQGNVKVKKMSPTSSRHKILDRNDKSLLEPKKITKVSTARREVKGKKNTEKSHSLQSCEAKVKDKESTINLDTSATKKTSGCKSEGKNTVKHAHAVSKSKSNTCFQVSDSGNTPSRVKKEKIKSNTTVKLSRRGKEADKHPSKSSVGSSLEPHSENETTAKKAKVLTNPKESKKASSVALSSQGKVQNKPEKRGKVKDEAKAVGANVVGKGDHIDQGKSERAKTMVRKSPRIAPRKVLKKLPSNATSKVKIQPRHGNVDRTGNPRKRPRAVDNTEVRQAKKLRLEEGNNPSSNDASTTEIPKPSTKHGEYNSNRENQPPSCNLEIFENKMSLASGTKLKNADEYTCMDESKKTSNEIDSSRSKTILIGRDKCLVFKRRHVNQLFIRGDNVVMVAYSK